MGYEDSIHTALYLSKTIKNDKWSLFSEAIDTFVSWEMYRSSPVFVTMNKSCIRNVISYRLLMVLFQWHGSVLFINK